MPAFEITRLLQSPLGQAAEPGQRGDIVRVSDGYTKVYLDPDEFDEFSEDGLKILLVAARREARRAAPAR